MNADAKLKQLQDTLAAEFQKRMEATPQDASMETWHQSRALAYAHENGQLVYELRKALRTIDALENKLDGSAGMRDLCAGDGEHAFFGKLDDSSPCLLDVTDEGRVQTVYIAGSWVDADYFADKAHQSWGRQIAAHVEAMQDAA
jgi:hypothetical protein